jgi:hypothetical protein
MQVAQGLFEMAYAIKAHQLRLKHPDWTDDQVKRSVMQLMDAASRRQ